MSTPSTGKVISWSATKPMDLDVALWVRLAIRHVEAPLFGMIPFPKSLLSNRHVSHKDRGAPAPSLRAGCAVTRWALTEWTFQLAWSMVTLTTRTQGMGTGDPNLQNSNTLESVAGDYIVSHPAHKLKKVIALTNEPLSSCETCS